METQETRLEDIEKDVLKMSYHDFEQQVVDEMRKIWESISAVDPLPPFDAQRFERRVSEILFKFHASHITETETWNREDYLLLPKQPFMYNGQKFIIEVGLEMEEVDAARRTFQKSVIVEIKIDSAHLNTSINELLGAGASGRKRTFDMVFSVNTWFVARVPIKKLRGGQK